ncbi:MAG TPA: hypothetical protein VG167_01825 [Verrucomicrobiae bacterium]|nr:hypothetical protein [Verrucomicrobiae bacterium]
MSAEGNLIRVIRSLRLTSGLLLLWSAMPSVIAAPSLTIYNQNFAVVRETVPMDLKAGTNRIQFTGATAYLEPSSVVLRDPADLHPFQILEQNYRGDPVSQATLLQLNEGKTIDFEVLRTEGDRVTRELVQGKIIRAGSGGYGPQPYYGGYSPTTLQPIIEVNGKLRFELPGQPLFPALADNTILKPTLLWVIDSPQPARFDAELSYITSELRWESDYNLVLPERGNTLDLVGWITMDNQSGRTFENARIKLMAGDVSKIQNRRQDKAMLFGGMGGGGAPPPPVTEKSFDEYRLYTLDRPATLLDREKKQVEFVTVADVQSTPIYIYDGASTDPDQVWAVEGMHTEPEYGVHSQTKVWALRQFFNSATNHLGLPLPKGRVRIYRRDTDGRLEFVGENTIKHTPRDELVRLFTGNAFDLVGERKRTEFKVDLSGAGSIDPVTGLPLPRGTRAVDEWFEITLRNHKTEPVEIRVLEHLCRGVNWEIQEKSDPFEKIDSQTIEFRVPLEPDAQRRITYHVHYSW